VSAAEVVLLGKVFEGDAAGAVEGVAVLIDNCAVRERERERYCGCSSVGRGGRWCHTGASIL
jgi:hypothetical protein